MAAGKRSRGGLVDQVCLDKGFRSKAGEKETRPYKKETVQVSEQST